jgi:hypothetical protein
VRSRASKLEALCLNPPLGLFYRLFCRGEQRCPCWASGHLGAIGDPSLPDGAYDNPAVTLKGSPR